MVMNVKYEDCCLIASDQHVHITDELSSSCVQAKLCLLIHPYNSSDTHRDANQKHGMNRKAQATRR